MIIKIIVQIIGALLLLFCGTLLLRGDKLNIFYWLGVFVGLIGLFVCI